MNDLVVCIITKRKPPVQTLEHYSPYAFPVAIIADPDVVDEHRAYYRHSRYEVHEGVKGMGPQSARCYSLSAELGYSHFFRLDDDLQPKTFVGKEKDYYPLIDEVITEAAICLQQTGTTLAGFMNTSNRYWMGRGYGRTWGLVTGGANISVSAEDPSEFIDPNVIVEDVYRTCAHREHDLRNGGEGRVGRVKHIGIDKRSCTVTAGQTSISESAARWEADRQMILARFPDMVSCDGTRWINNGRDEIVNWKLLRGRKR